MWHLSFPTQVPVFEPKSGVKIETDPKATQKAAAADMDDEATISALISKLESAGVSADTKVSPITFEKDDDTNFHMEVIAGFANMRARAYSIQEVDKLKAKLIAGRIIPAIATTTSLATGFVCLEIYKVVLNKKIEDYRNTFANLALPLFAMAEPIPSKQFSHGDNSWSLWDRWILEGDLTVQEVRPDGSSICQSVMRLRSRERFHAFTLSHCLMRSFSGKFSQMLSSYGSFSISTPLSRQMKGAGLVFCEGPHRLLHVRRAEPPLQQHLPQAQGPPGQEAQRAHPQRGQNGGARQPEALRCGGGVRGRRWERRGHAAREHQVQAVERDRCAGCRAGFSSGQ